MSAKSLSHPQFLIVFFDLEATGLGVTDEIIQIGAKCQDKLFNEYVIPSSIPKKITEMTGISMTDGQMYHHGEKVNGVAPAVAIANFLQFLKSLNRKIILVAHNCFDFDGPMLVGVVNRIGELDNLKELVAGFSDTLPLFRKSLPPNREKGNGYKLSDLGQEFLGAPPNTHDAITVTNVLEELIKLPNINITVNDIVNSRQIVGNMTHKFKNPLNSLIETTRYDDY